MSYIPTIYILKKSYTEKLNSIENEFYSYTANDSRYGLLKILVGLQNRNFSINFKEFSIIKLDIDFSVKNQNMRDLLNEYGVEYGVDD